MLDSGSIKRLKTLRKKIDIPLDKALELLKKHDGDIALCEHAFHTDNIEHIAMLTQCDEATARENYLLCEYDVQKAMDKIHQKKVIITMRENKQSRPEIGFVFWPEDKEGRTYKTLKRNDMFIPTDDFDVVIEAFRAVFPIKNPYTQSIEEEFDVCGTNVFDVQTCRQIIQKMGEIECKDAIHQQFITELVTWLEDKLTYAEYIIVYGNL